MDGLKAMADEMSAGAEASAGARCLFGEAVFWLPADTAVRPGHIYSEDGRAEFKISQCCEFHFDEMFPDDDA